MLPVTCCYWRQEYTVKPHFTVTSLLRTVFLVPSPYISSKFNSLNRDTFYCPLRVRIKWVWLYMDWNFSSFNAMYAKTTKKLWQMLPNGIFLIALSSSYQYTSILCITWWQNPFKLETQIPTCLLRSTSFLISVGRIPGSKSGSGNSTTSFSSACRNKINYFSNLRHYRKS